MTDQSSNPTFMVLTNHEFAEVWENNQSGQKSLHATVSFKAGDIISSFSAGEVFASPTYLTVQTGTNQHITLRPEFLQYCNHSCDPNVFFDTKLMQIVALKDIQFGEEMTFFYPSTEWAMAQPFNCYCCSPNCLGAIQGAAFLPDEILNRYQLTDYIRQQLIQRSQQLRA